MSVNSSTTNTYVGGGTPQRIGNSATDKVGFFGTTEAVQPASANQALVASTAAVVAGTVYGFSGAQANGIVTLLNQIRNDLVTLGILKGSA